MGIEEPRIESGYRPGAIGRIAELHGVYYHAHWRFGLFFEAKVATELAAFLRRYDEGRDGFWTVTLNGRVEGSVAVDGVAAQAEGAHLRWFILSETLRGRGLGGKLLERAVDFCDRSRYRRTYLWTFEGLDAARRLYERAGFRLVRQQDGDQWGTTVHEQCFARAVPR